MPRSHARTSVHLDITIWSYKRSRSLTATEYDNDYDKPESRGLMPKMRRFDEPVWLSIN